MAMLQGKKYTRTEILKRTGNLIQVAGVKEYSYAAGRAHDVKALGVDSGGGLQFEVVASRCLDISHASYKGIPFGYISKSGMRHPAYFAPNDPDGFLRNFYAGVLTTCGLHNIGSPCERDGKQYHLHGDIANIPADHVSISEKWDGDECTFGISGEIRHSCFYAEDTVVRRRIATVLGSSSFTIEDEVENQNFAPAPCLLLYHANFGFPFLDASTRLLTSPIIKSEARPGIKPELAAKFATFSAPVDGENEVCIYHTFKPDANGNVTACLFNPDLGDSGMGVYIRYAAATLPHFVQWKMLRSREYVCGLEPGTALLENRDAAVMQANTLQPLEKRTFKLEIGVLEGEDTCRNFIGS